MVVAQRWVRHNLFSGRWNGALTVGTVPVVPFEQLRGDKSSLWFRFGPHFGLFFEKRYSLRTLGAFCLPRSLPIIPHNIYYAY